LLFVRIFRIILWYLFFGFKKRFLYNNFIVVLCLDIDIFGFFHEFLLLFCNKVFLTKIRPLSVEKISSFCSWLNMHLFWILFCIWLQRTKTGFRGLTTRNFWNLIFDILSLMFRSVLKRAVLCHLSIRCLKLFFYIFLKFFKRTMPYVVFIFKKSKKFLGISVGLSCFWELCKSLCFLSFQGKHSLKFFLLLRFFSKHLLACFFL